MGVVSPKIDVFIPAHAKDFSVLPLCIRSLKKHLRPASRTITVVCVESEQELRQAVADDSVKWLQQDAVEDILPRDAMPRFVWEGRDRSGWYYQQLLKYALRKHSLTRHYLVMDADTVFVRRTDFTRSGRYVFYASEQFHEPYFRTYQKLLGYFPERQPSFITDYMILDSDFLDELLQLISARANGAKWYDAILAAIDPAELSSFSEYETYGYYLSRHHPECFESVPLAYTMLPRNRLKWARVDAICARRRKAFSISYHDYL